MVAMVGLMVFILIVIGLLKTKPVSIVSDKPKSVICKCGTKLDSSNQIAFNCIEHNERFTVYEQIFHCHRCDRELRRKVGFQSNSNN